MKNIILVFIIVLLSTCDNSKECEKYYNDYVDFSFESKNQEALTAINKAIKCDNKNEDFRFEKVKYLISNNRFLEAKEDLLDLGKLNNSFITELPLYAILELKLGNKDKGEVELKSIFKKLSKVQFNKDNFTLFYYKLITQLYVEGKRTTINEIETQNIYTEVNDKAVISYLAELINSKNDSLNILYKVFQIND